MTSRTELLIKQIRAKTHELIRSERLHIAEGNDTGTPLVIRQAAATRLLLGQVPLVHLEGELLAGSRPTMPFPDFATEEEKSSAARLGLGPETQFSHVVPGFARVLQAGFAGLAAQATEHLQGSSPLRPGQVAFWTAARTACEAVVEYSARYGAFLRQLGAKEQSGAGKQRELLCLAELCERVPANPATDLHEALQSLWFTYAVFRAIGPCQVPLGRLDQLLWPYWQASLKRGMSEGQCLELLEQFFVKLESADYFFGDWRDADNGTSITLGGVDRDGAPAINDLTYLCLKARAGLPLRTPTLAVRVGKNTPSRLLRAAIAVMEQAPGSLAFHNDDAVIPALQAVGIEEADARDWACQGCVEPLVPGKTGDHMIGVWLELLKYLELALNDGQPILTGDGAPEQTLALLGFGARMDTGDTSGPPTGDAETLERAGFAGLLEAYKRQVQDAIERKARESNEIMAAIGSICPTPLLSATFAECMERGLDRTEGGCKYYYTGTACRGVANVANALAAIKKLVFEERRFGLRELVDSLESNFQSAAEILAALRDRAPKFGNDDDYVDTIARDIAEFCCDTILAQRNPFGFAFKPGFWASWYHAAGKQIAASPDGRRAQAAIAPNCSPAAGTGLQGPSAVIRSVAKIDFGRCANGMALDLALPASLAAERNAEGVGLVESIVRSYCSLGGMQVQFNLTDKATLLRAQADPEAHRDLLVRVWGFSAFFVTLTKDIQDQIIARC